MLTQLFLLIVLIAVQGFVQKRPFARRTVLSMNAEDLTYKSVRVTMSDKKQL